MQTAMQIQRQNMKKYKYLVDSFRVWQQMQILKAIVKNYKSLKRVEVDFDRLTILVGRNGSGKSNFLEALQLFFNQFTPELTRERTGAIDYLWHNRETKDPIDLAVTIKLTKPEYNRIFSKDKLFETPFKDGLLKVCRQIAFKEPNTAIWSTSDIIFNDVPIILQGKLGVGPASIAPNFRVQALTKLLTSISQELKDEFKLILSVRDAVSSAPSLGERSLNILPEIHAQMVTTFESDKLDDSRKWANIEKDIEGIPSLRRLHTRGGKLRNREGIIRFPLSQVGGGDQEILALTFMLRNEKAKVFAIEEPETHLHPSLSRTLFGILKDISKRKQLIITTHSPIFVDLVNLNSSWIFRKENGETKVFRIQSSEDLKSICYELDVRPSDVFFADKILFVEGAIDKTVYRIWAEKLGIDLSSPLISVISLDGKTKGKRHLQAWIEVTKNIPVFVSMILDNDAKNEAEKLIKDNLATRNQISILSRGAIEDYYDTSVLMTVMSEKYGEEFTRNDLKPSQYEGLMKFLKRKHKDKRERSRVKYEIGEAVAPQMTKEQIHRDIRDALLKTKDHLELQ